MLFVVAGGIATEDLAGELLLCDATGTAVHRISGEARHYFEQLGDGPAELPEDEVTAALAASGVIVPFAAGVSRRRAIAMGAAAAAAVGVMSMPLPSAAQVASTPEAPSYPPAPSSGTTPLTNSIRGTFQQENPSGPPPPAPTQYQVLFSWTRSLANSLVPVSFNWRLWSPGSPTNPQPPANLIASGTSLPDGTTGWIDLVGTTGNPTPGVGTTFVFLATAAGGAQVFRGGTIEPD